MQLDHKKKGYLVPITTLTTDGSFHLAVWLDRSSKDVLSMKEKRKRTASACSLQDWREDHRSSLSVWVLLHVLLCGMEKWNLQEANDQICARRSLHSPKAANGRRGPCRCLSASPASTPLWSQCLQNQADPREEPRDAVWRSFILENRSVLHTQLTCGLVVHAGKVPACKASSKCGFANPTFARHEDFIMNGVHGHMRGHHRRLQQACWTHLTWKSF